jgi:hypothetical protein
MPAIKTLQIIFAFFFFLRSTFQLTEITDEENEKTHDYLNNLIETWNVTPIEKTIGPIPEGETEDINYQYSLSKASFYKIEAFSDVEYLNALVLKFDLKASLVLDLILSTEYRGVYLLSDLSFVVIGGVEGRLKIIYEETSFGTRVEQRVIDHNEYDMCYLVVMLNEDKTIKFNLTTTVSMDVERFKEKNTNTLLMVLVFLGVVGLSLIIFFLRSYCAKKIKKILFYWSK